MRRTTYRVAGETLAVEARDRGAAEAIDMLFARWYVTPEPSNGDTRTTIAISTSEQAAEIPSGLQVFEVAGGGTCHTDGTMSYIEVDGSVVAIAASGRAAVQVWIDEAAPLDGPAVTRVVTYALAAALRQRKRFELHSGAVIDPETGTGVLIVGPSGCGKSTLTVNLASAGWPFLTDDVLLLSRESAHVSAWPLRRWFAVTSNTLAHSHVLQARTLREQMDVDADGKQHFLPHSAFASEFRDHCVPGTLLFPELTGAAVTRLSRLSRAETMSRLIRMNPWSCYDRLTAHAHLAVLSSLAKQSAGYVVHAGTDLLQPEAAIAVAAACVREVAA